MKIAVCQIDTVIGDIKNNKKKIIDGYRKGVDDKVDLVVFPELALPGYPVLDLVEKKEFRRAVYKAAKEIASVTNAETALIFGSISEDDDGIGTDINNSAIFCLNGKIEMVQNKSLIPNYDVFDEMRYFDPAKNIKINTFKGVNLGISICEDIWNDEDYWHRRRYIYDPVKELITKGSQVLINISASPYAYGKREDRRKMFSLLTKKDRLPLVYCCCTGAQTDLIFDGASMCFNGEGNLLKLGKTYSEDYYIFDTEEKYAPIENCEGSFEEEVLSCVIYGLREYCGKNSIKQVLLGLSGGMDSALVAYIAAQALGSGNVNVVMMPSQYSSIGSVKDSEKLIKNLGIKSGTIPVKPVFDEMLNQLQPFFKGTEENIAEENIQARIRGMYLMALSNKFGYLLLATGNKSEFAVGYSTLYGDMCGGLSVIADIYKTDVYRIAHYINRNEEIIPREIIDKAPSAELKPGQTDQDTLPPYPVLDRILKYYLEENKELDEISELMNNKSLVEKVLKMVDKNEFKRFQAAPVLRVSKKAFGYGRRYPVVQGWRK